MALAVAAIAKLLGQLTILIPATDSLVRSLRDAVSGVRNHPSADNRLDGLERALKLQVEVTESLADQLRIVQSVLTNVQKSLKVLAYTMIGTVVVAILAITIALSK